MLRDYGLIVIGITLCVIVAFAYFVISWATDGYAVRNGIMAGTAVPSYSESQHEKPDTTSDEDTA